MKTALLALLLCACASTPPKPMGSSIDREEDARLIRYTSKPWGFSTNSFVIEGPTGLVVIDVQFLPSAAEQLITQAEKLTGKKVELAIVLHANPDKFNGTATFQKHGIKVVTSDQIIALLPSVHEKRTRAFYDRYQPDYPVELPKPESLGSQSTRLEVAGLTLGVFVMGAGCSEAHLVVTWEGHAFVGDLVANKTHAWLEIGKTDEWLTRLQEVSALGVEWVHPGRGASGSAELIAEQTSYLQKIIDIVAAEKPTAPSTDADIARVTAQVEAAYPGYGYPVFLRIGLPAEWRRQLAQAGH